MNTLTKEDWVEIYYALDSQSRKLQWDGEETRGHCLAVKEHAENLADDLREIMQKIGPNGENMHEPEKDRHYLLAIWCDIEPSLFGPFPNEEERDKKARELHNDTSEEWGLYPVTVIRDADRSQELLIDSYSGGFFEDEEEPKQDAN